MQDIIKKYFEGKASEAEKHQLLNWLRQEDNLVRFRTEKKEWLNSGRYAIDTEMVDRLAALQTSILKSEQKQIKILRLREVFFRYAAVLAFAAALTSVFLNTSKTEKTIQVGELTHPYTLLADYGQMSKAILPDGSKAWVNSGSELKWNNGFGTTNRDLELKGEGYFEVAGNKELPLYVNTGALQVKVTGTSFNVAAYENLNMIDVVLESGSIELYEPGVEAAIARLEPGKMASLNKSNRKVQISTVNVSRFTAWKEGIINIYDQPLEVLAVRLEKRYNQKFNVEDKVKMFRFTFTIKNEGLEDIIRLMESIAPVKSIQEKEIITFRYDSEKAQIIEKNR
jgi:transmembrane sensor